MEEKIPDIGRPVGTILWWLKPLIWVGRKGQGTEIVLGKGWEQEASKVIWADCVTWGIYLLTFHWLWRVDKIKKLLKITHGLEELKNWDLQRDKIKGSSWWQVASLLVFWSLAKRVFLKVPIPRYCWSWPVSISKFQSSQRSILLDSLEKYQWLPVSKLPSTEEYSYDLSFF